MTVLYMSGASLIVQYLTNLGLLAQSATLVTYQGGTVSTPLTTYTDSTGLNVNPNPMTLSQAGRPATASGAPIAFWHAGGVSLTLQVTDASGNLLVYLPNIPAINDPSGSSGLQSLLANPSYGDGADLVANAVKSYDVVATVQSLISPTIAASQTLVIAIQGGVTVGDGLGGLFYWAPTSTASDDGGITTIIPNGAPAQGRYLRLFEASVGQFTATLTGMTASTQGTVKFIRCGRLVHLWIESSITGTSNATNFEMTGLPAELRPSSTRTVMCSQLINDSGVQYFGNALVDASGTISFAPFLFMADASTPPNISYNASTNTWTAAGTKGLNNTWSITYGL